MAADRQTLAGGADVTTPRTTGATPAPIGTSDHTIGELDAPLQLIEYGDYECPFCGMAFHGVELLIRRHSSHLVYAWRHFPLVSQHPHAWDAALAAEAAGRQGRFWEMHEQLLSHQRSLAPTDLMGHAQALGLDVEAFELDLVDEAVADRVRRDAHEGMRCGVHGTPTFFVNGRMIEGGYREQEIESALLAELRRGSDAGQG